MKLKFMIALLILIAAQSSFIRVNADPSFVEPVQVMTTAYTAGVNGTGTVMANGREVFEGAIAGKEEWMGKVAYIYKDDDGKIGDWLGCFEFCDTGGTKGLNNGSVIDVYRNDYDRCVEWMADTKGKVWIQIFDAKG